MKEIKRFVDKNIKEALSLSGVVSISGPKWCGKTHTGEKFAKSIYYVRDVNNNLINLGLEQEIFDGEFPRLIDEWQILPEIWDKLRHRVDINKGKEGMYIITGSSTPVEKSKIFHSGAGRFLILKCQH